MIYFAAAHDRRIKIGYSANVKQRLNAISEHLIMPVKLIGVIDGDLRLERAIHFSIREKRLKGEWYADDRDVRGVIDWLLGASPERNEFIASVRECRPPDYEKCAA